MSKLETQRTRRAGHDKTTGWGINMKVRRGVAQGTLAISCIGGVLVGCALPSVTPMPSATLAEQCPAAPSEGSPESTADLASRSSQAPLPSGAPSVREPYSLQLSYPEQEEPAPEVWGGGMVRKSRWQVFANEWIGDLEVLRLDRPELVAGFSAERPWSAGGAARPTCFGSRLVWIAPYGGDNKGGPATSASASWLSSDRSLGFRLQMRTIDTRSAEMAVAAFVGAPPSSR